LIESSDESEERAEHVPRNMKIETLMEQPASQHNLSWLQNALQAALE
jgi:hypothetical protein